MKEFTSQAIALENGKISLGSRCELKSIEHRYNKRGEQERIERDGVFVNWQKKADDAYALVAEQTFDKDHRHEKTNLEVNSPQLLRACRDVIQYHPDLPGDFEQPVVVQDPFEVFFHYRKELAQYRDESKDDKVKMHIKLLLDFLHLQWGDLARLVDAYDADGLVRFKLLWTIFKPGDLIYREEYGHERLYRLDQVAYQEHKTQGPYLKLDGLYTYFDGNNVGMAKDELRIYQVKEFAGEKASKIQGLSLYPLRYRTEIEALKKRLTDRGHRFLGMQKAKLWFYHGLFVFLKEPPGDFYDETMDMDGIWLTRTETGRVMVDFKTFSEEARLQVKTIQSWEAGSVMGAVKRERALNPLEADPLISPPFAYGYSMSGKTWCKFFLDNLEPVEWKENALEELILPGNEKRIVRALVNSHQFPDRARNESSLKGKGLTILLHGPPGSGKTMTAESVAENTKRPLMVISTGELGSWERSMSFELKKLLSYASIWKAIVLIDEADVFLEARKSTGANRFQQNSMVAVFLRQLEFFQGILFLTSNRVAVFDEAITSRIHLILEYSAPTRASRALVWRHYLHQLNRTYYDNETNDNNNSVATVLDPLSRRESDLSTESEITSAAEKLSAYAMNGREISNAAATAHTLAEDERERLRLQHVEIIVGVWDAFNARMRRVRRRVKGDGSGISREEAGSGGNGGDGGGEDEDGDVGE